MGINHVRSSWDDPPSSHPLPEKNSVGDLALFDCSLCVPVTHWACAVNQAVVLRVGEMKHGERCGWRYNYRPWRMKKQHCFY